MFISTSLTSSSETHERPIQKFFQVGYIQYRGVLDAEGDIYVCGDTLTLWALQFGIWKSEPFPRN